MFSLLRQHPKDQANYQLQYK